VGGLILSHVFETAFAGLLPILLVFLGRAWKKQITYPRLGYAELSAFRQKNKRMQKLFVLVILAVMILFTAMLLLRQNESINDPLQKYARVFFMSIITVILVGVALFRARQAPILYVFVGIVVVFWLLVFMKIMNPSTMLLISGAAFVVCGLIKLARFIRNNPRIAGDATHDDLR
jgi:peptidoglycan/LPS O-acetylase OafA/YrhL